jgi:hypothetical protein
VLFSRYRNSGRTVDHRYCKRPWVSMNLNIGSMYSVDVVVHSCYHSVMTYGLIYWRNSSHAEMVFKLQKRGMRLMMGHGYRESCRDVFKEINIQPLKSKYIYSLIMFVIKNR